jgi:hypothetical protein
MTVLCRGWQKPHEVDDLVAVKIAYRGALHFPARYLMCTDCVQNMQKFVDQLRTRYGPSAVDFLVNGNRS